MPPAAAVRTKQDRGKRMKKLNSDVIGYYAPERKVQAKFGASLFLKRQHPCVFSEAKIKTYAIKEIFTGMASS
jgi:hypothetical protein